MKVGDWIQMNSGTQSETNIRIAKILRSYYEWRGKTYQDLLWITADNSPNIAASIIITRSRVRSNPKFESDLTNPPVENWMFRAVMKILFNVPSEKMIIDDNLKTYHHTPF